MPENRIWQLRKDRNLTQRELAQRVGTSQQQIQRVEAGVVTVRLDLAAKIADALGVRLAELFPKLVRSKKRSKTRKIPLADADRVLTEVGVDPDPKTWTAKFFMNDGRQFLFPVSSADKDRLESSINESDAQFLVFDSDGKRLALNRTRVGACQFLFDYGLVQEPEDEEEEFKLRAHFVSSQNPIVFDVEPDECALEQDDDGFRSQLQSLFLFMESATVNEVAWFDDVDNERVYIRVSELLLIEVPLVCCEPALWEKSHEGFVENEQLKKKLSNSTAERE